MSPTALALTFCILAAVLQNSEQNSRQSRHDRRHTSRSSRVPFYGSSEENCDQSDGSLIMEEEEAWLRYGSSLDQTLIRVNCSRSCSCRETVRQLRLDSIKKEILRKLKITTLPIVNRSAIADIPAVRNMLSRQTQSDSPLSYRGPSRTLAPRSTESIYSPHQISIYSFAESDSVPRNSSRNTIIRFPLEESQSYRTMLLLQASMGVYIRPVSRPHSDVIFRRHSHNSITLTLYMIDSSDQLHYYTKVRLSVSGRYRPEDQWAEIDITSLVRDWLLNPRRNRGVAIDLSSRGPYDFEIVSRPQNEDETRHRPYLELTVRQRLDEDDDDDYGGRSRRSSRREDCDERGMDKLCCRYPLIVNFDDIGWDWIIAPRQYEVFYCAGDCPFAYINTNANSFVVQQSSSTVKASGGPCCSASNLSPISLLYFDLEMRIIRGVLQDMVVNKCRCA